MIDNEKGNEVRDSKGRSPQISSKKRSTRQGQEEQGEKRQADKQGRILKSNAESKAARTMKTRKTISGGEGKIPAKKETPVKKEQASESKVFATSKPLPKMEKFSSRPDPINGVKKDKAPEAKETPVEAEVAAKQPSQPSQTVSTQSPKPVQTVATPPKPPQAASSTAKVQVISGGRPATSRSGTVRVQDSPAPRPELKVEQPEPTAAAKPQEMKAQKEPEPQKIITPPVQPTSKPRTPDRVSNLARDLEAEGKIEVEDRLAKEMTDLEQSLAEVKAPTSSPDRERSFRKSGRDEYQKKVFAADVREDKPFFKEESSIFDEADPTESRSNRRLFLLVLLIMAVGFLFSTFSGRTTTEKTVEVSGTEKLDLELIREPVKVAQESDSEKGLGQRIEEVVQELTGRPADSERAMLKPEALSEQENNAKMIAEVSSLTRLSGLGRNRGRELAALVVAESNSSGIDPKLAAALVAAESSFQVGARSSAGKIGLMQIAPEREAEMLKAVGMNKTEGQKLSDPQYNLRLGLQYLGYLKNRYQGNMEHALIAYNQGPENLEGILEVKSKGYLPNRLFNYLKNINAYRQHQPAGKPAGKTVDKPAAKLAATKPAVIAKLNGVKSPELLTAKISWLIKAAGISRAKSYELADLVISESRDKGFDPFFTTAVVMAESSFQISIKSKQGKIGLMQILPAWEKRMLSSLGLSAEAGGDLTDPKYNLSLGLQYLKKLENQYDGNLEYALIAYNRGPGNLDGILAKHTKGEKLPSSLINYLRNIQNYYNRWTRNRPDENPLPFKLVPKPAAIAQKPKDLTVQPAAAKTT